MTRTLIDIDYHRNGVSGVGFFVSIFKDDEADPHERFLGIQFEDDTDCYTAVIGIGRLCEKGIQMHGEDYGNAWRGDHFSDWLREQQDVWRARMDERLGITRSN